MGYYNGRSYTDFKGLNLKGANGAIRFEDVDSAPSSTSGEYLLYVDNGILYFDNGSSATAVGAAGGSGGSLDSAYDVGRTIAVNAGSVILAGANEDTAVLNITLDGSSAGAGILIANSGTGNDVTGTSSLWSVAATGAGTFAQLNLGDDEDLRFGATQDFLIKWVNASSYADFQGATNFDGNMTIEAPHTLTLAGSEGSAVLTVTAGDVAVSDGSVSVTDDDNAVSFSVTNNTATTIGAAASDGVVEFVSTSLTTGALLSLELTEGTLNGGSYIRAWDVTAAGAVFTVGEDGNTTIAGVGGSNMFTISAGDAVLSDGSITVTDADNAATVSVTNNTATTIGAAASGGVVTLISTSLTTGALLNLQLTEGTLNGGWYVRAWDATGGAAVFSVGEDGLTTIAGAGGSNMLVVTAGDVVLSDGSVTITDADNAATLQVINNTATTIGAAAATGLVEFASTSLTTGSLLHLELTEATLNGGHYLKCWDVTAGATVFSVGEDGATFMGTLLYQDFTEDVTATNVITAAESGSVFFLNSATEFVSTLPAPAAGLHFTFIVKAAPSGANYTVVTNSSSNVIKGTVHSSAGGDADSETAGCDTINFVDGVAVAGDMVEVWCDGTNWFAKAFCDADGGVTFTTAS